MSNKRCVIIGNVPAKSNCYRIIQFKSKDPQKKTYPSLAKTKELREYERGFSLQCMMYRNANISGQFKFEGEIFFANERSDLDNSLKVILDCLEDVNAIVNDKNCAEIHIKKRVDKLNPRAEFNIFPLSEQPADVPTQADLFSQPKQETWV